ncbi:hypothetical protein BDK51DRAFT_40331 [Blyttiomyces helicus]|uniref:Uncharacterized protein n=1 Tax=Blyttiomyces helicus TaxID=388810 RepID=A0A4P9W9S3_9FUNG|nr:hypothetical protein BDK51DRAFT_40331 [Blyttiomyces helicus]|eukprot:RKO89309.1 hypothetical protein BDK51DRAFT_40331 [Blyttiomyces helicus]
MSSHRQNLALLQDRIFDHTCLYNEGVSCSASDRLDSVARQAVAWEYFETHGDEFRSPRAVGAFNGTYIVIAQRPAIHGKVFFGRQKLKCPRFPLKHSGYLLSDSAYALNQTHMLTLNMMPATADLQSVAYDLYHAQDRSTVSKGGFPQDVGLDGRVCDSALIKTAASDIDLDWEEAVMEMRLRKKLLTDQGAASYLRNEDDEPVATQVTLYSSLCQENIPEKVQDHRDWTPPQSEVESE